MEIFIVAQNKAKLRAQLFIKGSTTYFLIGTALSYSAKEGSKLKNFRLAELFQVAATEWNSTPGLQPDTEAATCGKLTWSGKIVSKSLLETLERSFDCPGIVAQSAERLFSTVE